MAEESQIVTSAIIVPDALVEPPPIPTPTSPSLKRRQYSISEDTSTKRLRLSADGSNNSTQESPVDDDRRAARRQSGKLEERKRGQRLFGALLGTLSQSSSSTAQKRRTDIEKRQQAKLKQQADEVSQRQHDRLEELMAKRRREQERFDEQAMHIRHSNLLHQANFLLTKTEPRLYFKPWDLLPEQEKKIAHQAEEAQATIAQELADFEKRRKPIRAATVSDVPPVKDEEMTEDTKMVGSEPLPEVAESHIQQENGDTNVDVAPTTTNGHTTTKGAADEDEVMENGEPVEEEKNGDETVIGERKEASVEANDVVVDAAEDTIIY